MLSVSGDSDSPYQCYTYIGRYSKMITHLIITSNIMWVLVLVQPTWHIELLTHITYMMSTQLQHQKNVNKRQHQLHCDCSSEERTLSQYIPNYTGVMVQSLVHSSHHKTLMSLNRPKQIRMKTTTISQRYVPMYLSGTPVVCTQLWHHYYPSNFHTLSPTLHWCRSPPCHDYSHQQAEGSHGYNVLLKVML